MRGWVEIDVLVIMIGVFLVLAGSFGLDKAARFALFEKKRLISEVEDTNIIYRIKPGTAIREVYDRRCHAEIHSDGPYCLEWEGGKECHTIEEFQKSKKRQWKPGGDYWISSYPGWEKTVVLKIQIGDCK